MKTFLSLLAVLCLSCVALAENPDAKARVSLTLTNGKTIDYKLDWIDENKIVVFEHGSLKAVTYKRSEVASLTFVKDESGKFKKNEEGFVLKNGTKMSGHPTSMDKDTYWIVPQGSRKEERVPREDVVFIQLQGVSQSNEQQESAPGGGLNEAGASLTLVTANEWEDTGVDVSAGQKIWFTVSGQQTYSCGAEAPRVNADGKDPFVRDPRNPLPDVKHCALIAKIGKTGQPFRVGLNQTPFAADHNGRIFIEVNDYNFADNLGKVDVYIKTGK